MGFGRYSRLVKILEHACKFNFETKENPRKTKEVKKQLKEYFQGKRKSFDLKLDINYLPEFKQKVLKECAKIPSGKVSTYGKLAKKAGSPKAARAVGQTMASNPISLVIPCHRVIGSDGHLTGFGGGLNLKKKLLVAEGIKIKGDRVVE